MIEETVVLLMERWDFFAGLLTEHLQISFISIFISIAAGLGIGILISEFKKSSKIVMGIVNFIYTIPSISLLGFLIPFSGIGDTTAVIALSVYALLPMVRNTYIGIANVSPLKLKQLQGWEALKFRFFLK